MVKFFKEDFKYIERHGYYNNDCGDGGYCYSFSVCGESANYLINKYGLEYSNVRVNLFTDDNSMTVGSKTNNKLKADCMKIDDTDDLTELLFILQEDIRIDQINYEEYLCDAEYNKYDSRWK